MIPKVGLRRARCKWCLSIFFHKPRIGSGGNPKYCCPDHVRLAKLKSNRESKKRHLEQYRPVKRAWNQRNKEKIEQQRLMRYERNKMHYRQVRKQWRFRNRLKLREYAKQWRINNQLKVIQYKNDERIKRKAICGIGLLAEPVASAR
jgi:hypothetical protein